MNKTITTLLTVLVFASSFYVVSAHEETMMDLDNVNTGPEMMRFIEDQSLGSELHEEMEGLMVKMMSGSLTETEVERIASLMNEYPGPHSVMMSRLGMNSFYKGGFSAMHTGSLWSWIIILNLIIWLFVGVVIIIWFLKRINSKK